MKRISKAAYSILVLLVIVAAYISLCAASTSKIESNREKVNAVLAKQIAEQGMVLLENKNNSLPLKPSLVYNLFCKLG